MKNTMKSTRIEDHMTEYPSLASERTTVSEAIEFMERCGVRHLPVVKDGKVIGIVSDRDLKQVELLCDSMHMIVSDIMTANPYCVKVGTPISTVAREMTQRKFGCTVVVNQLNQVVGIFTTTDGMNLLSRLLESGQASEMRNWGIEKLLSGTTLVAI